MPPLVLLSLTKQAQENWLLEQCTEMEEYEKKFDNFNMRRKVREILGTRRILITNINKNYNLDRIHTKLFQDDWKDLTEIGDGVRLDLIS